MTEQPGVSTGRQTVSVEQMREAIMFGRRVDLGDGVIGYRYRGEIYVPIRDGVRRVFV